MSIGDASWFYSSATLATCTELRSEKAVLNDGCLATYAYTYPVYLATCSPLNSSRLAATVLSPRVCSSPTMAFLRDPAIQCLM